MAEWVKREGDSWTAEVNGHYLEVWFEKGELEGEEAWLWRVTDPNGNKEHDEADSCAEAKAAALDRTEPAAPTPVRKSRIIKCAKCGTEYEDEGTGGLCRACWNEYVLS